MSGDVVSPRWAPVLVAWAGVTPTQSIFARWFNADGTPATPETRINGALFGNRGYPAVARQATPAARGRPSHTRDTGRS